MKKTLVPKIIQHLSYVLKYRGDRIQLVKMSEIEKMLLDLQITADTQILLLAIVCKLLPHYLIITIYKVAFCCVLIILSVL